MSTDELGRLERRLEVALHATDDQPVDVPAGRLVLHARLARQQREHRRWTVVGIAASVVAVIVTTSFVVSGLRDDDEGLPVAPPKPMLSRSGLPVGLLEGKVMRSAGYIDVTNFRMRVRPDGTGTIAPSGGTTGTGDASGGYEVEYDRLGPGRVAVRYEGPICASTRALTLTFTVRGHTLTITDARSPGCLVSEGLTADLAGTTMVISPLPADPG
jgi:hypothetical protein